MFKKVSLLSLCFVVGCVASKLAVTDFKPYEGYSAFVYITADGAEVKKPVAPPVPNEIIPLEKCKCKGTGKSGDGLGPCNCPSNCYCKQNKGKPAAVVKKVEKDDDIDDNAPIIVKQVFIFHAKWCGPCKFVDKELDKLKDQKLGWKISEKRKNNERKTARAHFVVVDIDDFPVEDHPITSIPYMMKVVNGQVVDQRSPFGMSYSQLASYYNEN